MGNRASQPVKNAVNSASVKNAIKPKDMGPTIAKNMMKMDIHAIQQNSNFNATKKETVAVPEIDKISLMNCKMLFKDASTMSNKDLSIKYRLTESFIQKLTGSYSNPTNK